MGQLQSQFRRQGGVDPISSVLSRTAGILGAPLARGADVVEDFGYGLFNARALAEENRKLSALARIAEQYQETTESLRRDNERLRAQLSLPVPPGRQRVVATVWNYTATENRLSIGAGSNQGVRPGQPVVAPAGLVGVVQVVERDHAQVQLLTSPLPFKIGAMIEERSAAGLLHGEGPDRLVLEFSDMNLNLATGDLVVTSGFAEHIPRGLPIGRVVQVISDPFFGRKSAQVFPLVKVADLREVTVLK